MVTIKLLTQAEADESLANIAEAERQVSVIQATLNSKIDALKTKAAEAASVYQETIELETTRLKNYAKNNRVLFQGKQTMELPHGKIGFRKSSSLALAAKGDTWDELLGRLEENGEVEAIKIEKKANKEVMEGWSTDRLAAYGVKVKETERFFCQVAETKVSV